MQPRILSTQHEEGYYIIWNTTDWRKERVSDNMRIPLLSRDTLTDPVSSALSHSTTQISRLTTRVCRKRDIVVSGSKSMQGWRARIPLGVGFTEYTIYGTRFIVAATGVA